MINKALAWVLAVEPQEVSILAVTVSSVRRRLEAAPRAAPRVLQAAFHRFAVVYSVAQPPLWVAERAESLLVSSSVLAQALGAAGLTENLMDAASHPDRPCAMPQGISGAPLLPCAELGPGSSGVFQAGSSCTPRCLAPAKPTEESLTCFAGLWSPARFACLADAAEAPPACQPPSGVRDAAEVPCLELLPGGYPELREGYVCTPACLGDLVASEFLLACASGRLTPTTFSCNPPYCPAPLGIPQAAAEACAEGLVIGVGGRCTAVCARGYLPTRNLTCERGFMTPPRFACMDEALAAEGGGAGDGGFWGEPPTTTRTAQPGGGGGSSAGWAGLGGGLSADGDGDATGSGVLVAVVVLAVAVLGLVAVVVVALRWRWTALKDMLAQLQGEDTALARLQGREWENAMRHVQQGSSARAAPPDGEGRREEGGGGAVGEPESDGSEEEIAGDRRDEMVGKAPARTPRASRDGRDSEGRARSRGRRKAAAPLEERAEAEPAEPLEPPELEPADGALSIPVAGTPTSGGGRVAAAGEVAVEAIIISYLS